MTYYATWWAHGQTYETTGTHNTLESCQREVFGRPLAPQRDSVRFWQVPDKTTD